MIPFREPKWELCGGRFSRKIFRPPPNFLLAGGSGEAAAPPARFTAHRPPNFNRRGGLGGAGAPPSLHRRNSAGFSRISAEIEGIISEETLQEIVYQIFRQTGPDLRDIHKGKNCVFCIKYV